jgi:hypothetical protein
MRKDRIHAETQRKRKRGKKSHPHIPCSSSLRPLREILRKFLTPHSSFLIILFSVICISCDLFSGPRVDLLAKIDEEVAWANAEKLTNVAIIFPDGWGTSNPSLGTLTDTMDIRKGFPINVEFSPSDNVTFISWIPIEPEDDTGKDLYERYIDDKSKVSIVTLASNARRRAAQVTIFTSEPVILLPLCNTVPGITGTEPPLRKGETGELPQYGINEHDVFRIYFNLNMDPLTVDFGTDKISIAIEGETDPLEFFKKPKWNNLYRCIVIELQENETLPENETITLTIGTEVTSYLSSESMETPVSFLWKTKL